MTVPDSPFSAVRYGSKWTVEDVLDSGRHFPLYAHQHEAQQRARELNAAYAKRHTPRPPQPAQPGLFDDAQEAI